MKEIVLNLSAVKERMREAFERTGRGLSDVKLLLATKPVSADREKIRKCFRPLKDIQQQLLEKGIVDSSS